MSSIKVGDQIEILEDNLSCADVRAGDILKVTLVDKWGIYTEVTRSRKTGITPEYWQFTADNPGYRLFKQDSTTGIKHDNEKPDLSLLSPIAITKVAEVMTFGKKKYAAHNWRGGLSYSRLLAATLRHTFAYVGGESIDPESGFSHAAHAVCCLMMLLEFETTRPDLDDRYKTKKEA